MVKSWLGQHWKGSFLVSWSKTVTFAPERYHKPPLYAWIERDRLLGFDYVDESNLAAPAMHDTENPLTERHWSTHYHRKCARGQDMHVCSVVCDATAQQLLHMAYARDQGGGLKRHNNATRIHAASQPIKFCLNCPPSLVPFTINPWRKMQNTTCHAFVPVSAHVK